MVTATYDDTRAGDVLARVLQQHCLKQRIFDPAKRAAVAERLKSFYEDGWTEEIALFALLVFYRFDDEPVGA